MKEIFPGLYQLTITLKGFSPGSVNVYLIREGDHATLIDTGWDVPDSVNSMESQLAEFGFSSKDIDRVILTHCHSDHLGMMRRLKERNKAVIHIHRKEIDLINFRYNPQNDYWEKTDRFLISHGTPENALPTMKNVLPDLGALATPDVLLEGGEEFKVGNYNLQVINTPGHTQGHISLFEPDRKFLVSGDVLLPTITTNAATHIQLMKDPLQQYLDSLTRLKEMDIDQILPGHEYVFTHHRQRIEAIFEHHRQRAETVRKVIRNNPKALTAYDVALQLPWTHKSRIVTFDLLGELDRRFAMMQSIAHLEALASAKEVISFVKNNKIFYQSQF